MQDVRAHTDRVPESQPLPPREAVKPTPPGLQERWVARAPAWHARASSQNEGVGIQMGSLDASTHSLNRCIQRPRGSSLPGFRASGRAEGERGRWCSLERRPAQASCSECTASWEQELPCACALRVAHFLWGLLSSHGRRGSAHVGSAHVAPLTWAPVRCWPQRVGPLTVCPVVSSRIFFPGCHPVRGVQVMKVGKLQLHQGMFPQAMKNLRLVSARRAPSAWLPFAGCGQAVCILAALHPCVCMHTLTHVHTHVSKNVRQPALQTTDL